ncbi:RTC4-like domain-containing protein [Triangularia setosa]|uniref:Restriction of telomere capping protein 4 n=1 Tax=Triangularia setosa TaxID=2587417 RepID=A0AAN7AC27_9PEZI|nr:RTC4-like domain-containing protein [Podospora setosa]
MVTYPTRKINAPWGSKGRIVGLTRTPGVNPLLKIVNGKPISQTSQDSTDKRPPDDISTPSSDSERSSMNLPSHISSPSRSSDMEAPRRDLGAIPSSPGQFVIDSPIPSSQESAPNSSQASTRGRKTARESTESVDDSDSDENGRVWRGDIRPTDFQKLNKDDSTAVLISSDSKKVISGPGRHAQVHRSGSGLSAASKPNDDVQGENTANGAIFVQPKIRKKQRTFSRKKAADDEPSGEWDRGERKRGGPSTSGRNPKKQKGSQEEKKNSDFSGDERASTRTLPEPLPPPEYDSSPLRAGSSIPQHLGSSPLKPRSDLPNRLPTLRETPGSATQIEPFRIPDLLDDPFRADVDWTTTPTAATSKVKKHKKDDNSLGRSHSPIRLISSPVIPLSEPPSSPIHLPALLKPAVCPLCKEEVGRDLLTEYQEANPRQTVPSMQRFCIGHRKRSAREIWELNGYPDIKWRKLDQRIASLYPFIRSILQGKRESYYATRFRNKIKGGQNKTLLSSDENLTPGYYGIRGLRQMSENLIQEFSSVLRKRALEDSLISARGHTAYLQAVLVPELATRLVMEDMIVEEEEARGILVESSWVGELVNDEIADVVFESDSEEE